MIYNRLNCILFLTAMKNASSDPLLQYAVFRVLILSSFSYSYAYVEFPSEDETSAARDKYKELTLNDEKLFVIRAIPVRKDRFGN